MRLNVSMILVSTVVVGCAGDPEVIPPPGAMARNGGTGGWDYNTDRWNELGERLPFGVVRPSTITGDQHVVWAQASGEPPCVGATAGVTATSLRGSYLAGGLVVGPEVVVTDGASVSAPLAIGASVAMSVSVRTESEPVAAARAGALVLTRVADFRRPPAEGEVRTRHVWPQYEAVFHLASACAEPVELGVAIVGPAPRFADGQPGYVLGSLPGVFELYSTYHWGQEAALVVKAAFNLDLSLAFAGEAPAHEVPCGTVAPVGNNLAFLAAFAIGNAHLVDLSGDQAAGSGGGSGSAAEGATTAPIPTLLFATQPGQAIRLSALFLDATGQRALCHTGDAAAVPGTAAANRDLAWPASAMIANLDAIVADGWTLAPADRAANPTGFRLASGTASRRLQAFSAGSALAERAAVVATVQVQAGATRLGAMVGAVPNWGALRAAAAGKTQALIAVESLPLDAPGAYDHEVDAAINHPTCGDGVCGWDAGSGLPESCTADCEGPPPSPPSPPPPPPPPLHLKDIMTSPL